MTAVHWTRSTLWFVVVGVINTGVYYVLYLLMHAMDVPYLVAHVVATLLAMVLSYFLNCFLTFKVRPTWRTFLLFPLSNLANFVITTVGMSIAVSQLGVGERIAPLAVAVFAIPITYLLTRYLLSGSVSRTPTPERTTSDPSSRPAARRPRRRAG
ncbi:sugar transferase [Aeromicrobium flavum]|uniref:Sugar transferase n=1 Tax=Aeromicrobium flavum TaxID=416568 RepID=A0A512HWK9_9ACTN|nr:GtrA family protein [Aeromicrobium flavum]GEO89833.1 sugar transferase [Aeromicrobium flavum]